MDGKEKGGGGGGEGGGRLYSRLESLMFDDGRFGKERPAPTLEQGPDKEGTSKVSTP